MVKELKRYMPLKAILLEPLLNKVISDIANESLSSAIRSSINSWIHLHPDHRQQTSFSMDRTTIS